MSDVIVFNTENQSFGFQQQTFKCSGYGLGALVKDMSYPLVIEIGCDIGDTANFLLDSNPDLTLFSVDPYMEYQDWNGRLMNEREEMCQKMNNRLKGYSNRFTHIRKTSDDAVGLFDDEHYDLVFIDGLHTYEQLTIDCANYYSKVKPGGVFAGHDFTAIEGVNRAAKEFAAKVGKEILTTECDVWYWIK
jgi:predicted O-methyltransferase YrrM